MTDEMKPPTLPGEVWRVAIRDTVCAVLEGQRLAVWWHGAWDYHPLCASEREEVLWAWAEEHVWLGAMGQRDLALMLGPALACSMLAPGGVCAALLRLAFIMEGAGRRGFRKAHPCDVLVLDKRPSFTREILSWASDEDLWAMAQGDEKLADVRKRLSGSDSAAYAWALFGQGRGGRYQVLEAP